MARTPRTVAGSGDTPGGSAPQPRRRSRVALASVPMRYLARVVDDADYASLNASPVTHLNEDEQEAFRHVQQFVSRYTAFPTRETLMERGVRLPDAPEPLAFYRDELLNQIRIRSAATLIHDLQPALQARDGAAVQTAIAQHQDAFIDPGTVVRNYAERREETLNRFTPEGTANTVRPTGLVAVDQALGGVRNGNLWVIAGRPGYGKTYLQVAACISSIREGERVLYVTKELSEDEMEDRILTTSTNAHPGLGTTRMAGTFTQRELQRRVVDALSGNDANLFIFGQGINRPSDVERLIREYNPTKVLIDGTYFLEPDDFNPRDSRNERYEKLIRNLQQLGKRTNRSIGITWQQNRTKAFGTDGLYGSDALSQDAALVLMIKKYKRRPDLRGLWVSKNRHGTDEFEIGTSYEFKPTRIGEPAELPQEENQRERTRNREDHTQRAVQQAMGQSAPGAQ